MGCPVAVAASGRRHLSECGIQGRQCPRGVLDHGARVVVAVVAPCLRASSGAVSPDGYWERQLNAWGAAGATVVESAGGHGVRWRDPPRLEVGHMAATKRRNSRSPAGGRLVPLEWPREKRTTATMDSGRKGR